MLLFHIVSSEIVDLEIILHQIAYWNPRFGLQICKRLRNSLDFLICPTLFLGTESSTHPVILKVPKLCVWGPQFHPNCGWNEKTGWKQYTVRIREKTEYQNLVFSPKLNSNFHFSSPLPWLLLIFFIILTHVRTRASKSSELIPSFMKPYSISPTLGRNSNRRWNRD